MSISSCPGLQSSQELADCAADPAEPCKCCSHQLECTGAIVLIIFSFLSAPFHLKIVVGLNCRRHCNTITPCHRPVWTYNCCLPRPLCVMFWCICQLWGSGVGMGAMCTTCSPILFSSDQLMSFLAGVSVRCELLSARVVTLVVMRAPDLGGSTSRMPSWRAGSQTHVWLWFNFVNNSVTAGIQCMARICFLEFKSKPRKSDLYKWHGVMKSFSTALGANLLPLKAMGALSEGDAETQAIIITISHSCCRWWWGFSATSAAATPVSIFSDLTGSGGSCDDSLPNYIWIHFCLPAGLPVCPLSQLRKEILDNKSISPEVQDYFFQLAGMNILRAARLLTLGNTQKTAQIHLRHWTWSFTTTMTINSWGCKFPTPMRKLPIALGGLSKVSVAWNRSDDDRQVNHSWLRRL